MSATLWTALAAALATGVVGSVHCAAMCGPLAVAGCTRANRIARADAAGYFAGRFVSYALAGAVLGQLGAHALCRLPVGAAQAVATVAVALAAAWRGVVLLRQRRPRAAPRLPPAPRPAAARADAWLLSLFPRRGLGLGLATGVLPCGMLLTGWTLAASSGSGPGGALVMATFSLATLPGLLAPLAGRRIVQRALDRLPAAAYGAAWLVLAAWLAARPLLSTVHHHAP